MGRPNLSTLSGVLILTLVLLVYFSTIFGQALTMLSFENPVVVAMGVALLLFPILGLWALVMELKFGFESNKLGKLYGDQGLNSINSAEQLEQELIEAQQQTETNSGLWQPWFRLGILQDLNRQRSLARKSLRTAIKLQKAKLPTK